MRAKFNLKQARSAIESAVVDATDMVLAGAAEHAKADHPSASKLAESGGAKSRYSDRTGNLTNSIDHSVELRGDKVVGTVFAKMEYAPYVEDRFPFILPAMLDAEPRIEPTVRAAVKQELARV